MVSAEKWKFIIINPSIFCFISIKYRYINIEMAISQRTSRL